MNPFRTVKLAAQMAARATPQAQGWFKDHRHQIEEGETQLIAGNYPDAEFLLLQAASAAEEQRYPGKRHGRILLHLATARWKLKKTAEARQSVEAAIVLLKKADSQQSTDFCECLSLLGAISLEQRDVAGALPHFTEALRLEEKLRPRNLEKICERYADLAETHKRLGELGPARSLLERALKLTETEKGPKHPATVKQIIVLGLFFQDIKNFPDSLRFLERATEIHKKTHGDYSDEVAQDYQLLADFFHASGDLERAVDFYQKALYLRERQLGGNSADLAALMVSLAEIYSKWGRYAPAVELLQQAVGKYALTPDHRMANTLESLSDIYNRSGRYSEAANCLTRARGVWETNPGDNDTSIQQNASKLAGIMENLRPDELDALRGQTANSRGSLGDLPPMSEFEHTEYSDRVGPNEHSSELPFGLPFNWTAPQSAPEPFVSQRETPVLIQQREVPQSQHWPFPFVSVPPETRPLPGGQSGYPPSFGLGQMPSLGPMHLTFFAPESIAPQHIPLGREPQPTVTPQHPAMSFSHAELGHDRIAAKVRLPSMSGLLRLQPMEIVPYTVEPPRPQILSFRKHGIRLRRRARTVTALTGLPSCEMQELELRDPHVSPLRHLSSAQPLAFAADQIHVPVRKISAAHIELCDELQPHALPENDYVLLDCVGAPSHETVFFKFTTLPPAFTLGAPPIVLPDALKLKAQPVAPPQPQFAPPVPLPPPALADLGELSFDFLVLKY